MTERRRGRPRGMTLERAISLLRKEYERARTLDYVRNPLAWALYQIWKKVDKEAPEVEAVQVVRCKDCAQWGGVVFGNVCRRWSAPLAGMKNCTGPEDFCSYGQRKEK